MTARNTLLSTWIPEDLKVRFAALAASRGISDSALLKQLVEGAVIGNTPEFAVTATPVAESRGARITIRLLPSDRLLLRERAAARGMRAATYVSTLTRAHLRSLSPLPAREIDALQGIAAQLAAMGRNLCNCRRALLHLGERGRVVECYLAMLCPANRRSAQREGPVLLVHDDLPRRIRTIAV